jgi:3',5'-cyclic AMP phosphodiesterase CpdA
MLAHLASQTADYVLFSGDLTTTALPEEFAAGARAFAPLRDKWSERLILIPGNHDRYTPRASRERWFERHMWEISAEYPFARTLNSHWTLIAFDCSVPRLITSRGRIDAAQFASLERILQRLAGEDRRLVVMGHYPLLYPPTVHAGADHLLAGRAELLDLLQRHGVSLYLHGHKHIRWGIEASELIHLNCGSAGMLGRDLSRAPGYLKIILKPEGLSSVRACVLLDGLGENPQWAEAPLNILKLTP